MVVKLRENNYETLKHLAEYRILTMSQLAAVCQKKKPSIRKHIRGLRESGFVKVTSNELGHNFGRPENLLGLTEQGIDTLKDKNIIPHDVAYEKVGPVSFRLIDHQLLINWFRIHLGQIKQLKIRFLSYNSPFVPLGQSDRVIITDYAPIGRRTIREVNFTPDAVFTTTNTVNGMTLLFFLEVDCGTETLSSPRRDMKDIRQKILNYQWYFQSRKYKRYEKIFENSLFHGFRLLFLTKTVGRLAALCRLVQEMQPSNFIWLTEQERMFNDGVFWNIWARGGNLQIAQQSILGSMVCRAPLS